MGVLPGFRPEPTGRCTRRLSDKGAHLGEVGRRWPAEGSGLVSLPAGIRAWDRVPVTL